MAILSQRIADSQKLGQEHSFNFGCSASELVLLDKRSRTITPLLSRARIYMHKKSVFL